MKIRIVILFTSILFGAFAQEESVWMQSNKGQWEDQVLYRVDLIGGKMYLENDGFTYLFYENPRGHSHADHSHVEDEPKTILKTHTVKTKFIGSNWQGEKIESNKSSFYSNYFIGNDQSKWKSEVYCYANVVYKNFYPNIDLSLDGANGGLKYSFHLQSNTDPSIIKMSIDGEEKAFVDEQGNLHLTTSLGKIIEKKPIAWSVLKNGTKEIEVKYVLRNNELTYEFPNGFDASLPLVIDPDLVFSTYTGSTADNWGMTATPGPNGETYAGGISFGIGYPITPGAIDVSYNGGMPNNNIPGFDIAISKFNENGSQLLFSTYLGGNSNELPESLIASPNGDLYVLGITGSPNFPMAGTPFDNGYNGGTQFTASGLIFPSSDIIVAKMNATGTVLQASTYVGGNGNDGANTSTLAYNYGDAFRGEIIIDGQENVYIASHSRSSNLPVTNGTALSGTQDAIVIKLPTNLSSLAWCSFYGGSGNESGNSLSLSSIGELLVAGGTTSSNFNLVGNDLSFGGVADGYLLKLNSSDGSVISGTYMGDAEYDQTYFVQLDIDDFVYVYGQSESSWAITPGCYGNANSGQFLRKYTNDLSTILWTTMFGASSGRPEISPTAFLISDCYDIFVSGWGGLINSSGAATGSTTNGFPITPGAYQTSTNGSNFYLGIYGNDASSFVYGTFMGGLTSSSNHVDGGTSRFDKSGAVYHAVCAACGGNDFGFTSTPGAWSFSNPSPNCNLAAFKFQLGEPYSLSANSSICNGDPFQLNASGGISYSWSPAGSLSNPNIPNPVATPTQTTVYYVTMDFNEGCAIEDSVVVTVINEPDVSLNGNSTICFGDTTTLVGSGVGLTYSWSPNINIDNVNTATVNVWPTQSQYYYCTVTNECFSNLDSIYVTVHPLPQVILTPDTIICRGGTAILTASGSTTHTWQSHSSLTVLNATQASVQPTQPRYYYATGTDGFGCENRDSVFVDLYPEPDLILSNDTTICLGTSTPLSVAGADSYVWTPNGTLTNPTTANPIATPLIPTTYFVNATYAMGCVLQDSVRVNLMYLPVPVLPDTLRACHGVSTPILASGATSYVWSPGTYLNQTTGPSVLATALDDITYTVAFTNVCGTVFEDVVVIAIRPDVNAFNDTIVCPGNPAYLFATGGLSYSWSPVNGLSSVFSSSTVATPLIPTMYVVSGTDQYGCIDRDSVFVDLFPKPFIQASIDQYLFEGESAQLSATSVTSGPYEWSPAEYLSCINCVDPIASPPADIMYTVSYTDENGCRDSDNVWIYYKPLIWVPNTFTPDGTGFNDFFQVKGGNVRSFKLMIFNRWGELVHTLNDISESWDGTYKGNKCQDGTYTWKLSYEDLKGNETKLAGHVNLVR